MARTWLSIRVDLVEGRGERFWPRPGRVFAAARSHSFAQLAAAIDDAFGRWDRSHQHQFDLADGTRLAMSARDRDEPVVDDRHARLEPRQPGERFVYVFDLGDGWTHLCTVGAERIDPLDELGIVPASPTAFFGWGGIPDQYGRRWDDDDGESPRPPDPGLADLPPLRPGWGEQAPSRRRRLN